MNGWNSLILKHADQLLSKQLFAVAAMLDANIIAMVTLR